MEINTADFEQPGLYLLFPEGKRIVLTRERIKRFAHTFECSLDQIPLEIRSAVAFHACEVCPERGRLIFCHALPATLAFFDELNGFKSYDRVSAVYRGAGCELVCVPDTTMQEALQFVVILSLMFYCEIGKKYWKFFTGVHPLMDPAELINRVHLNIHWHCKGDGAKIEQVLQTFADEIACTCECQVKRLRLICKNDALLNAFVNTQAQIECLALTKGALLNHILGEATVSAN
ncbi:MAG TPA: hypothetical protein VMI53_02655 [Opitutaceae bacterium]|nr:hypothetical protein [Opitutaceae bacterium]